MEKIKALLVKSGCKPELVNQLCESLEEYKNTLKEQYDSDYKSRIEQAKKVCVAEMDTHKRELARRLQIFCETKAAAIEAQLARQSALSESEASTKLRNIQALLEGIEPNGELNGNATAALEKAKQIQQVNEEKAKRATETANRQMAIAERALKQNRQLTMENANLKAKLEQQTRPAQRPAQRLDEGRNNSRPTTTRQTLLENQDPRPVRQKPTSVRPNQFGVEDIAAAIDEDLV